MKDENKYFVGIEADHIIVDNNYKHMIEEITKVDKKFKIKSFSSYKKAIDYLVRHMTDIDLIRFGMFYEMNPEIGKMVTSNPRYKERKEYKELMEAYAEVERFYNNVLKVEKQRHQDKIFNKKSKEEDEEEYKYIINIEFK